MRAKGQNIVEFVIILALCALACIACLTLLGGNVCSMLANSTTKIHGYKPFGDPKPQSSSQPQVTPVSQQKVSGYDVTINSDDSATFRINNQLVNLPKSSIDLANTVFTTTGSSGMEFLVKEIADFIQKHQAEYPGQPVPVQLIYGQGERETSASGGVLYSGNTMANSVVIQAGNSLKIIQNDQDCEGACDYAGTYSIEGTIGTNNTFTGNVTSDVNTYGTTHGTYTASVKTSPGLSFTNATYNHYDDYYHTDPLAYSWDIAFTDTSQSFTP